MDQLKDQFKYHHRIVVEKRDIDILNHVNNEVYLRWMMEAAIAHAAHAGYPVTEYTKNGQAFVVRRHEIDYLSAAVLGDEVDIETWCESFSGSRSIREYRMRRRSDGKLLIHGRSTFVFIDLKNGKPIDIPEDMAHKFMFD